LRARHKLCERRLRADYSRCPPPCGAGIIHPSHESFPADAPMNRIADIDRTATRVAACALGARMASPGMAGSSGLHSKH